MDRPRSTPAAPTAPLPVEAVVDEATPPTVPWRVVAPLRVGDEEPAPAVSPRRVVTQLVLGLLGVLLLVGIGGAWGSQRLAEREAVNDAAATADVLAEAVIEPVLTDALADGDETAVAALDVVVRERVLGAGVSRVKIWSPGGTVLYADEPQLVGRTFPLNEDQALALSEPQTRAEVSDLDESENEFEQGDRLLEVYRPVWTPSGRELLFEMYAPYGPVQDRASQLWRGFAGVTLSSLLLVVVLMVPIVWRLLRRLVAEQSDRAALLERSMDASDAERRRVAASLHDGPVQELVATTFAAEGAAAAAEQEGRPALAAQMRAVAAGVRGNIRVLRSLLVDIYPAGLTDAGLAAALGDLAETARGREVAVTLDLEPPEVLDLSREDERLVYRVAQECLRNVASHAAPCHAIVRLVRHGTRVVLDIVDDGPGFDPATLDEPPEGHLGSRVLRDLAAEAGAGLQVATAPGAGVHWQLTLDTADRPEEKP